MGVEAWASLGVGFLAIVASIVIHLRSRRRKVLSYRFFPDFFPLADAGPFTPRISVVVDDARRLTKPIIVFFGMTNTGNQSIKDTDYYVPDALEITWEGADLVAWDVQGCETTKSVDRLTFKPFLLNPKDAISVSFLFDGIPQGLSLKGRLADVTIKDNSSEAWRQFIGEGGRTIMNVLVDLIVPFGPRKR